MHNRIFTPFSQLVAKNIVDFRTIIIMKPNIVSYEILMFYKKMVTLIISTILIKRNETNQSQHITSSN